MSGRPAVSVAMPLYNKAAYVVEAVASALSQSFGDFELIVIDDGSTDDGPQRLRQFKDGRILLETQDNAGVAETRNRAMRKARSGLVAFLDADDVWAPDHLRHLVELSRRYPQAAMFGNQFIEFDRKITTTAANLVEYKLLDDYFATCAFGSQPFFTSSCMVRRETALAHDGFPVGHSRGEDLALWARLAAAAPVAVSNYMGCYYRRGGSELTSRPVVAPDISMQTIEDLLSRQTAWTAAQRNSAREYYYRIALAHCFDCLRAGEPVAAANFMQIAARTRALRSRWWQARLLASAPRFLRELVFFSKRSRESMRGQNANRTRDDQP